MKIIYLHGFASTGVGPKSDALKLAFGTDNVLAPDLPLDPDAVEKLVDGLVTQTMLETPPPLIFAGTSLGGFWANYFAQQWNAPCVMVNPSLTPSKTMWEKAGQFVPNYKTGVLMPVLKKYAAKFEKREAFLRGNTNSNLLHLFLAKDDNVLPYEQTLAGLPSVASCTVTETGGHIFTSQWDLVVEKIRELIRPR